MSSEKNRDSDMLFDPEWVMVMSVNPRVFEHHKPTVPQRSLTEKE